MAILFILQMSSERLSHLHKDTQLTVEMWGREPWLPLTQHKAASTVSITQ